MKLRWVKSILALAALGVVFFLTLRSRDWGPKPTPDVESSASVGDVPAADRDVELADGGRSPMPSPAGSMPPLDASATIVSAADRRPIRDADVRWWTDAAHGATVSNAAGSVALPLGDVACWISATGHQDFFYFDRLASEVTIELPLAAGLEISFGSTEGPEADVEVEAALESAGQAPPDVVAAQRRALRGLLSAERLTPSQQADLRACAGPIWIAVDGWKQVSDANGLAAWRSLPPGRWRWQLLSEQALTITPPFERAEIEFDGYLARANRVPRGTSGAFELSAGETLHFDCRTAGVCGVRGIIAFADRRPAAGVRTLLRRVEKHLDPLGISAPIEDAKIVGEIQSAADGAFEFQRLRPGSFQVTAVRADAQQHFDFATAQAEVAEGEVRDLGVLPLGGVGLAGRIEFIDAASRRVLAPLTVAATADTAPRVTLSWLAPHAYEVLSIAVGEPFEVRGLEPGRYVVSVDGDDIQDWGIDSAYRVAGELPRITFDEPGFDGQLLFEVALAKSVHFKLRGSVSAPSRDPWLVRGNLQSRSGTGGTDFSCVAQGADLDTSVDLLPGEFWVCATAGSNEGARAIALQRVSIPPEGGECVLAFQPAVELSGLAVSSDGGAALAGKFVSAAPVDAPADMWFFNTRSNERGEFTLSSVPAGVRMRFKDSADIIETRAPSVSGAVVHFDSPLHR